MAVLLLLHALAGAVILAMSRRIQRFAWAIGSLPMLGSVGYAIANWSNVLDGDAISESYMWIEGLQLSIDLRLDGFGLLMTLIVSGIGVAVMAYGSQYFTTSQANARIAGLLVLFSGSMVGLVQANHLLFLYLCWELTSITSWQLIGAKNTDAAARSGALHALLVTNVGGMALLAGLVLLGKAAADSGIAALQQNPYQLNEIIAAYATDPPSGLTVGAGLALTLVGIMTKSAQFPFHAWLPGAMVAPTPVSAYLHSATMVKAGIYFAARLAPVFAAVGHWRAAITVVGIATMLLGGLRALRQHDLKLLLAMGTISQLGFMLVMLGLGYPEATKAGVVLLLGHALFKAALFLVVGIVDHQAGTRDIRELRGFGQGWGTVKVVALISGASMAGLPPLLGFIAKEAAFEAVLEQGMWGAVTVALLVAGSVLTFAYSYRFVAAVLARPATAADSPPTPGLAFMAPAVVFTVLTVFGGVAAGMFNPLVEAAANSLDSTIGDPHLALWHGFGMPLYLSALVVVLGVALVRIMPLFSRLQNALNPGIGGEQAFAASVDGTFALARRVTGVLQSGSLPIYCAVILTTAVSLPGAYWLMWGEWPGWPEFANSAAQGLIAVLMIVAVIGAAAARRRFSAVLLLGAVGYGIGLLFILQGAPDLALTQFAVETLLIVVFVLVLRKLPANFKAQPGQRIFALRVVVATLVGVYMFGFALMATGVESPPAETLTGGELAGQMATDDALDEGEGRNVVNVVLVDFRGLDTMGEIGVLTIAALGIVALARVRRPEGEEGEPLLHSGDHPDSSGDGAIAAEAPAEPDPASVDADTADNSPFDTHSATENVAGNDTAEAADGGQGVRT